MQFLFIFVPLGLFFVAYTMYDIFVATTVLMIAAAVILAIEWLTTRTVKKMHLYTTLLLLVLGSITVLLRDPVFIKWKVTLVHWVFAGVLFYTQLGGRKPGIQAMMEMALKEQTKGDDGKPAEDLPLTEKQWHWFNNAWGLYFLFIGALNLFIAFGFDEAVWVKFKVFGIITLQLVFMAITMYWLFRKISTVEEAKDAPD